MSDKPAFVMPPRPAYIPPRIVPTAKPTGEASPAPAVRAAVRSADRQAGALLAPATGAPAPGELEGPERWVYLGGAVRRLVPVSFAAKDWGVTSRRIRVLLAAGRLEGCRQENGYWEVYHPYRVEHGLRGPALKHRKKPEQKTA